MEAAVRSNGESSKVGYPGDFGQSGDIGPALLVSWWVGSCAGEL